MPVNQYDVTKCVVTLNDLYNNAVQNVWHVLHNGPTQETDAVVINALRVKFYDVYSEVEDYLPTTTNMVRIDYDQVGFGGGQVVTLRNIGTVAGSSWTGGQSAAEPLPQFVSASLSLPTNVPNVAGRKSIGPLTEAASDSGAVHSGLAAALSNLAANLMTPFDLNGQECVFGVMSTKALAFVQWTGYVLPAFLGHQNTRKAGVGI